MVIFIISTAYTQQKNETLETKPEKSFLSEDRPWTIEILVWIPGFRGEFAYGDIEIDAEDGVEIENPIEPPNPGEPPGGGNIISRLFISSKYLKFFFVNKITYEKNKIIVQGMCLQVELEMHLNSGLTTKLLSRLTIKLY